MPATRKRAAATGTGGTKKQKTSATTAKKNQPNVKVDDGFYEDGELPYAFPYQIVTYE